MARINRIWYVFGRLFSLVSDRLTAVGCTSFFKHSPFGRRSQKHHYRRMRGASAPEYALILNGIALVAIFSLAGLGDRVESPFNDVDDAMTGGPGSTDGGSGGSGGTGGGSDGGSGGSGGSGGGSGGSGGSFGGTGGGSGGGLAGGSGGGSGGGLASGSGGDSGGSGGNSNGGTSGGSGGVSGDLAAGPGGSSGAPGGGSAGGGSGAGGSGGSSSGGGSASDGLARIVPQEQAASMAVAEEVVTQEQEAQAVAVAGPSVRLQNEPGAGGGVNRDDGAAEEGAVGTKARDYGTSTWLLLLLDALLLALAAGLFWRYQQGHKLKASKAH